MTWQALLDRWNARNEKIERGKRIAHNFVVTRLSKAQREKVIKEETNDASRSTLDRRNSSI